MLIIYFHDFILIILINIILFIIYILFWYFINKFINRNIMHNQILELIWTLIPLVILIFIAIPSLNLLYLLEETLNPFLTLKVLGHQWYWSYEYLDFEDINFDSFILSNENLINGKFRLLDVDNNLILPKNYIIRRLVTSLDVIHSWSIPCLGLKMDSVPGRINQCRFIINRVGLFYGQCSEICGLNHSFIPIVLERTEFNFFIKWLLNNF